MTIYEIDKLRKISVRHIGNWEYSFSNQIEETSYREMESISKLFEYLDFSDEDNSLFLSKKVERRSESDCVSYVYLQFSETTDDEIAEITKRYLIYRAENDRTRRYSNAELEGRIQ